MKTIENNSGSVQNETSASPVVKPLHTLEGLVTFSGETVRGADKLSLQEGIRLGVSLLIKGEECRARGVYVLAEKSRSLAGDDLNSFMGALKSELVNESVARCVELLPGDAGDKLRDKAKKEAAEVGARRFDNLGQTIRAAKWVIENPKAIANGVSVFTVQQALAHTKAPALKEGEKDTKEGQIKLECHKAVAKALATPGTSQAAIKQIVAKTKEKVEKQFAAPTDNRTEEVKAEEGRVALIARLAPAVVKVVNDIDGLAKAGKAPGDWRSPALTDAVMALAKLAGVELAVVKPAAK